MATISARGYVNKPESKVSAGGKRFNKFELAVKQKRKTPDGFKDERIYLKCVDFKGGECPEDGSYIGVTGYLTVTGWAKDGKGGANLDVTVTEYETLETSKPSASSKHKPVDDFSLDGIPF